jgi:hypothetical protein
MKKTLALPLLAIYLLAKGNILDQALVNFSVSQGQPTSGAEESNRFGIFAKQVKDIYTADWITALEDWNFGNTNRIRSAFPTSTSREKLHKLFVAYKAALEKELTTGTWINKKTAGIWQDKKLWANGYVKKLLVDGGSELFVHTDYHADIASLLAELKDLQTKGYLEKENGFKINRGAHPNFYMFFLGDFIDRGAYGIEVLYALISLALTNPTRVFLIKGNHETGAIEPKNFYNELKNKFEAVFAIKIADLFYNQIAPLLPDAIFVGAGDADKNFALLCHAGPQIGGPALVADLRALLKSPEQVAYQQVPKIDANGVITEYSICKAADFATIVDTRLTATRFNKNSSQYIWTDFSAENLAHPTASSGRGGGVLKLGKAFTESWLKDVLSQPGFTVKYILRGHQNNGVGDLGQRIRMGQGVSRLWDDSANLVAQGDYFLHTLCPGCVCTFLVTPDTTYGKAARKSHPYDVYGILQTNSWNLVIHQLDLKKIFDLTGIQIV